MSDELETLLNTPIPYQGEHVTVASLESAIADERERQTIQVKTLQTLQERNGEVQESLSVEVTQLHRLSEYVAGTEKSVWGRFRQALSRIPGMSNVVVSSRSVEETLREQYEHSLVRVKEAAEFADRLGSAEASLHDEIDRLNTKIIESARNEELAARHVLDLERVRDRLQVTIDTTVTPTADSREAQRDLDRVRRVLAEHSTRLQLYHTAESRLERLKDSTRLVLETIANLRTDMQRYVVAASEKLDLVGGQIRGIGAAADAAVVVLEMKRSLDAMGEALSQSTAFVANTQLYLRENIPHLVADLETFDEQTRVALQRNIELSEALEDERITRGVEFALLVAERDALPAADE